MSVNRSTYTSQDPPCNYSWINLKNCYRLATKSALDHVSYRHGTRLRTRLHQTRIPCPHHGAYHLASRPHSTPHRYGSRHPFRLICRSSNNQGRRRHLRELCDQSPLACHLWNNRHIGHHQARFRYHDHGAYFHSTHQYTLPSRASGFPLVPRMHSPSSSATHYWTHRSIRTVEALQVFPVRLHLNS